MLEQDIIHYTSNGDFGTNKLQHIINHNGINPRNDFTLTREITISELSEV